MRLGRWILIIILIVVAGVLGYILRGNSQATPTPAVDSPGQSSSGSRQQSFGGGARAGTEDSARAEVTIPVQTSKATSGTLVAQRQTAGTVIATMRSDVSPKASGVIDQVLVKVGDTVKAGQAALQLDDQQLQLAVQSAEASLQNAKINLNSQTTATKQATGTLEQQVQAAQAAFNSAQHTYTSAEQLYKLGGISQSELETDKSQLSQAQANLTSAKNNLTQNQQAGSGSLEQLRIAVTQAENQLEQAKLTLQNATVRAPFAGQIAAINVARGEYVGSATTAFTLVAPEREVQFSVPPTDAASLSAGQELPFNIRTQTLKVKIDQHPAAPVNQNVTLTAKILNTDSLPLGTVGTLSYSVKLAKGTLIPIASLQNDGIRTYVFTVESGKAKEQTVTVLAQASSTAAVTGVTADHEVIIDPPPGLLDGSTVRTRNQTTGSQATTATSGSSAGKQPDSQATEHQSVSRSSGGQGQKKSAAPSSGGQPSSNASSGGKP